ncbi:MAG: FkbM family methyltransferase [bacterium]
MTKRKKQYQGLLDIRTNYKSGLINKADYIDQCQARHLQLFDYPGFMMGTNISSIEIKDHGICLTTRNEGIKMMASQIDKRTAPIEMLNFGDAEKDEMIILKKLIKKNRKKNITILDVGANIGWFSLYYAKALPGSQIYSFEPIANNYANILFNIKLNGLKNIKAVNVGVSDHQGVATFYCDQEITANASLVKHSARKHLEEKNVKLVTLDKYCGQNGIRPDLLKVDVEGAELFVFKGAKRILADHHPIVFAEMLRKWAEKFNYHPNQIIELLNNYGYQCFRLCGDRLRLFAKMDDSTKETNFFFLDQRYHKI